MIKNSLHIPKLPGINQFSPVGRISLLLDQQPSNLINIEPWPEYPEYYDIPKVSFKIAHCDNCIFLKYDVEEHEVLARYRKTNDPVYKDSCVEFFIEFDNEKSYYNFEFNRLGTCLGSFGPQRIGRTLLPVEFLETIKFERTLLQKTGPSEPVINWTLMLMIPVQVFSFHKFTLLSGKECKVNFYKCGDDLSLPHYLTWNNVNSPEPNFHQPEFFGDAKFV